MAVVTPWNNPLAIPIGKIAPALLYGNTVLWKPAPAGAMVAQRLLPLLLETGWPTGALAICHGDQSTARQLAEHELVDGVTLSGSLQAGYALQEICAYRHVPFQAELGGNNAAIVWHDADLQSAADQIAAGAFGFAGQCCTANRRVIVCAENFNEFVGHLQSSTVPAPLG